MNQIYGVQVLPEDVGHPEFLLDGARPVNLPSANNGASNQVQVFAYTGTTLQVSYTVQHQSWVYVWGLIAHPAVSQADIPAWCANVVAEADYGKFKELLGSFVVIVDEPNKNRISLVSDVLGVRPLFFGKHNGRIVFGSKVWPLFQAGLASGQIDYDAVSAWISYGYNCSNGSLFEDLRRLPPGSVVAFQNGRYEEIPYAQFERAAPLPVADRVAEELHEIVSSTLKTLLSHAPEATLALSGGYDSRYLLALALSLSKVDIQCTTVAISGEEDSISRQVAQELGVPLDVIPIRGSEWDIYDNAFHFTADGFPVSKFVTYCVAQRHPKRPMLNGYMGDSLMRGSQDRILGKYEEEWSGDPAEALQRKHMFASLRPLRADMAERVQMRSRAPLETAVKKGAEIGKIFGWADFYLRQRFYISNNFLQHLDIAESLLPFYSWALLSYKMKHDYKAFGTEVYERIFAQNFPTLSKIPRADTLPSLKQPKKRVATCSKQWARKLLPAMCGNSRLSLLDKKWCMSRVFAGMAGLQSHEGTIHNAHRLNLLEERVRAAGIDFDWEKI